MITVTADASKESTLLQMDGKMSDLLVEAALIVNTLYQGLKDENLLMGALFQDRVRSKDFIWNQEVAVRHLEEKSHGEDAIISVKGRETKEKPAIR